MRKVILYLAMSLDGYIADSKGGVGWLEDCVAPEAGTSFAHFIETIDTVLMGRCTYDQITTELMPDAWPYEHQHTYVFSHEPRADNAGCTFTSMPPDKVVKDLLIQPGKDIWICGGANLIHQLSKERCVDVLWITMMPVILGDGIALFQKDSIKQDLRLVKTASYGDLVDLIYDVKK